MIVRTAGVILFSMLALAGPAEAQSPLKLYEFDCGRLRFESVESFGVGNDETDIRELVVPCYVVEREQGRLLWDGGLPSELASEPGWREDDGGVADLEAVIAQGEHDVFGDGRVLILPAPGHTPGHQVLYLDLENTGPIVLSGDLYHFQLSRAERRVPGFNVDAEQTLASMADVESFMRDKGAELWIEHDLGRFEASRHAPAFYD